jgi:hypothetical protein
MDTPHMNTMQCNNGLYCIGLDWIVLNVLDPLCTGVLSFVQNTPTFTGAISTRRTGTAPQPSVRIALYVIVVNVVHGLPRVQVKCVPHGSTIVTNHRSTLTTHGKARLVALAELVICIFANVSGKEKVNFSQVAL